MTSYERAPAQGGWPFPVVSTRASPSLHRHPARLLDAPPTPLSTNHFDTHTSLILSGCDTDFRDLKSGHSGIGQSSKLLHEGCLSYWLAPDEVRGAKRSRRPPVDGVELIGELGQRHFATAATRDCQNQTDTDEHEPHSAWNLRSAQPIVHIRSGLYLR